MSARTTQSYIAGVGASGALIAGAAITLVSLIGLVSFDVWPSPPGGAGSGNSAFTLEVGGGETAEAEATPLSEAAGLLASASPQETAGAPKDGGTKPPGKQPADPPDEVPAVPSPPTEVPATPPSPVSAGTESDTRSEPLGEELPEKDLPESVLPGKASEAPSSGRPGSGCSGRETSGTSGTSDRGTSGSSSGASGYPASRG